MKIPRWLFALLVLSGAVTSRGAEDWQLFRHEGRDYVALENIAKFYGFPPPPALRIQDGQPAVFAPTLTAAAAPPAPAVPVPPPTTSDGTPPSTAQPAPEPGSSSVTLDNGKHQLGVSVNSRVAYVNGVKQWLSFPTHIQEGKLLISRLDLVKNIEPQFRPEKIQGLKPVRTVVIDPGHGGHDKGALARYGYEKNFALDVSTRVRDLLQERGFKVLMTRASDVFIPLHDRPKVANNLKDAIFVSIHFNSASSNPLARGFEIFSLAPRGAPSTNDSGFSARKLREEPGNAVDTASAALSGSIYHSMLGQVPMEDRGIKHARFAVLRLARVPSVLIELGFLSNGSESALVGTPAWRAKVAESIVTGIEGYKSLAEEKQAPKLVAEYRQGVSGGEGAASLLPAPAPTITPAPAQN
ncbi:MAG: N-acetylmuramoyl-L-alanine amidase family protein [Chthoniobacteraceae bacterium]